MPLNTVILTIGPRGAGKTTFCKEIVRQRPDVAFVERDAILVELFGSASLSPYSGAHQQGYKVLSGKVRELLGSGSAIVLLDPWNGFPKEREILTAHVRSLGAKFVMGWYFVTSENVTTRQFMEREKSSGFQGFGTERNARADYQFYHRQPVALDQGFDVIVEIDPHQPTLFPRVDFLLPPRLIL